MRFLYYAFGAGLGHLNRGLAITTRIVRSSGATCAIITNSQAANLVAAHGLACYRIPNRDELPAVDQGALIREIIASFSPDLLTVDTFARGYYGELYPYLTAKPFRLAFVHRQGTDGGPTDGYDIVCDVETQVERHGRCYVRPVLIRNLEELPTRAEARRLIRADPDSQVVLAYHSGRPGEVSQLFHLVRKALEDLAIPGIVLRLTSLDPNLGRQYPEHWLPYYPVMDLLPGVDVAVVGGGYNAFYELAATGTPAVFVPMNRKLDDQFGRVAGEEGVARSFPRLVECLGRQLKEPSPSRRLVVEANAANEVAQRMVKILTE